MRALCFLLRALVRVAYITERVLHRVGVWGYDRLTEAEARCR